MESAKSGDIPRVLDLLGKGSARLVNFLSLKDQSTGNTLLHFGMLHSWLPSFHGSSRPKLTSPENLAAKSGNKEFIIRAQQLGSDPSAVNNAKQIPLQLATDEAAKQLIKSSFFFFSFFFVLFFRFERFFSFFNHQISSSRRYLLLHLRISRLSLDPWSAGPTTQQAGGRDISPWKMGCSFLIIPPRRCRREVGALFAFTGQPLWQRNQIRGCSWSGGRIPRRTTCGLKMTL